MSDSKKFETQVQQKLQELDFSPSPSVWNNIEAQLPPEGKRPGRFILWGSLLVAAMSAGGYFFFLNTKFIADKTNNSTLSVNTSSATFKNSHDKPAMLNRNSGQEAGTDPAKDGRTVDLNNIKTDDAGQNNGTVPVPVTQHNKIQETAGSAQSTIDPARDPLKKEGMVSSDNPKKEKVNTKKKSPSSGTFVDFKKGEAIESRDRAGSQDLTQQSNGLANSGQDLNPTVINGVDYHQEFKVNATIKNMEVAKAAVSPASHKKRWSFEPVISAGHSIYSAGKVNNLFTAANQSVLNSNTQSMIPGTTLYAPPTPPSEVKPGKSFSIGMDARYNLSKKLSLTGGVYYSLLTTRIQTGGRSSDQRTVDVNGNYRRINDSYSYGYYNDYTNKYHFIELPVLLYFQLNKGKKLPLYVNGGISYARLIKTNALHYDATQRIYYKANDLVKKDFFNVEGGVSAKFFPASKFSFIIGPEIQYGVTNLLAGKAQENDKHSLFVGVKLAVPLNL